MTQVLPAGGHRIVKLSADGRDTFFGYYDKTPFSLANDRVLATSLRDGEKGAADIGYFDLSDGGGFQVVGDTTTWSWQLGARLQWYPTRENETVAYNKAVGGGHGFVLQNVRTKAIEAEFRAPVFDISPDGRHAISLNFARLHRLRAGYGYGGVEDATAGRLAPDDDGVTLVDLESGARQLVVSLDTLAALDPQDSMEGAEHYVNHLSFSPSGERFFFLHLWNKDGMRHSRPVTADIDGARLFVLEHKVNMSHHAWKSAREILIHSSRKPFGTRFILYEDLTGKSRVIGENVLKESGHPSYSPDGKYLLVDTYPDRTRRQWLRLYTKDGEFIRSLGHFFSPRRFSGARKCDLHPRWDRQGSTICIDSAHGGRRAIYLVGLE